MLTKAHSEIKTGQSSLYDNWCLFEWAFRKVHVSSEDRYRYNEASCTLALNTLQCWYCMYVINKYHNLSYFEFSKLAYWCNNRVHLTKHCQREPPLCPSRFTTFISMFLQRRNNLHPFRECVEGRKCSWKSDDMKSRYWCNYVLVH